jgi:hypothetical protein
MYAHITKTKAGYELRITDGVRPVGGTLYRVGGKADARKLAASLGAQPWNF